jgi:hypothetical protein
MLSTPRTISSNVSVSRLTHTAPEVKSGMEKSNMSIYVVFSCFSKIAQNYSNCGKVVTSLFKILSPREKCLIFRHFSPFFSYAAPSMHLQEAKTDKKYALFSLLREIPVRFRTIPVTLLSAF